MRIESIKVSVNGQFGWVTCDVDKFDPGCSIVHFPGLPNLPFPIPGATEYLSRYGGLLQPHYPGTYDSIGDFSPKELSADLQDWWLNREKWSAENGASVGGVSNNCVLSLHSFGSYVGLKLLESCSWLQPKVLLLFAPTCFFGDDAIKQGLRFDLKEKSNLIERFYPRSFRQTDPSRLTDLFLHTSDFDFRKRKGPPIPTFVVLGENDPMIDPMKAADFFSSYFEKNSQIFALKNVIVVPGSGHDMQSLLSNQVREELEVIF